MAPPRATKPANDPHAATVQVGYWVALSLRPDAAPMRSYVGQVQAVDLHGIRLTLVDWLIGTPSGWDFFAPWDQITAMLIATPEHDVKAFREGGGDWQTKMNSLAASTV